MRYIIAIDGMACGMCEAHIAETIRKAVPDAKKVKASHKKKEATFQSEQGIEEAALRAAIDATGYRFVSMHAEEKPQRGLFR